MSLVLYSYFRSSAAYRVRIALNLKNVEYEIHPLHLLKKGGEQRQSAYRAVNPQGLVPALVVGDKVLTQSLAIIEYLEETYLSPPLMPGSTIERAYVRSLAQIIACDIHPLNNLRVLNYLKDTFDGDTAHWYCHWIQEGFAALEQLLERNDCKGPFCLGDKPGMADVFLIPQIYNALRLHCEMKAFPLIGRIYENCLTEVAFSKAAPENQPDADS